MIVNGNQIPMPWACHGNRSLLEHNPTVTSVRLTEKRQRMCSTLLVQDYFVRLVINVWHEQVGTPMA